MTISRRDLLSGSTVVTLSGLAGCGGHGDPLDTIAMVAERIIGIRRNTKWELNLRIRLELKESGIESSDVINPAVLFGDRDQRLVREYPLHPPTKQDDPARTNITANEGPSRTEELEREMNDTEQYREDAENPAEYWWEDDDGNRRWQNGGPSRNETVSLPVVPYWILLTGDELRGNGYFTAYEYGGPDDDPQFLETSMWESIEFEPNDRPVNLDS